MSVENKPLGPRIALVATDLSTGGGVNRVISDLAAMFSDRLDCQVTVLNGRSDRASTFAFPLRVELIDQPRAGRWTYIKALWRLRRSRPHFVIGSWAQDNILLVLVFLFASTKVVLVEHSSWHFHGALVRLLRRLAYPLADALVVLNPSDLAYYRRFVGNVRLLPNPVGPVHSATRARQKKRDKRIVAIGHLSAIKNFPDTIAAVAQSGLEADGWTLTIVGAGPAERQLREQIARIDLGRTEILPPQWQVAPLYQRSSILVLTSRSESFSLVLAEAMAAGVVPLAYATDGPSFILEDFPQLLVEVGDVQTLAERLRELAAGGDLEPLRRRVSASIRTRFAPEVIEAHWRELFGQLRDG